MALAPNDPAKSLWDRVQNDDLEKFSSLLDRVPVPVGGIAENLGISVVSLTLPSDISGLIRQMGNGEYEIQVNNTDVAVRQRFTVAHEIAHFLIHRGQIDLDGITDSILYRSKLSDRVEAEANKLGAAILLPWHMVRIWCRDRHGCEPKASHLEEIAKEFCVSNLSVGFRFGF